jgi:hypothetical protein
VVFGMPGRWVAHTYNLVGPGGVGETAAAAAAESSPGLVFVRLFVAPHVRPDVLFAHRRWAGAVPERLAGVP